MLSWIRPSMAEPTRGLLDTSVVPDHGQKIGEGTPDEVKEDPAVVEAYLGRQMDDAEVRAAIGSRAARRRRRDRSDAMRKEGTG